MQDIIRNHIKMGEDFAALVRTRSDILKVLTPPAFALTVLACVPPHQNGALSSGGEEGKTVKAETEGLINGDKPFPQVNDKELQAANELTKKVYERINKEGEIFLTSGVVNGIYAIRVVSANPKAEMRFLEKAFKVLVDTTEATLHPEGKQ